ncbi:MAG: HD domain-containing protein [Candidatus Micrarchaeota archaeon]
MSTPDYKEHARPRLCQALPYRIASRYGPALEGIVRMHVARSMLEEEDRDRGKGLGQLVRASVERLSQMERGKERWCYTKRHSLEVAYFGYMIGDQARLQGVPGAESIRPELVFAGGLMHDIGKTFLPLALVVKELGIDLVLFCLFEGARMSDIERRVLRDEHISAGTRYIRMFGGGDHMRTMLDMVGLHHVMYDGTDTAFPSYPSQVRGADLPFHSRIAKTADFISAVLPRHYRSDQWVESMRESLGYAIAVSGWELDPVTVRCAVTGLHSVGAEEADRMISRLALPKDAEWGRRTVRNFRATKEYVKGTIERDAAFRDILGRRDCDLEQMYRERIRACSGELNAPELDHLPE